MKKLNIKKIRAIGTAFALSTALSSCSIMCNSSTDISTDDIAITDNNAIEDDSHMDTKDAVLSQENVLETKIDNNAVEEDSTMDTEDAVLSQEEVLKTISADDTPFKLMESYLNENGDIVYQEFGPEFYEKEIDGLKYLIHAETKKVCISGYSNLGCLCCLESLKKENGGTDSDIGYSGYVLLAIYHTNGENLFSLYDFDDFSILLDKCDLDESPSFKGDIFNMYYLQPYDPKFRGHDDINAFTGQTFIVTKDSIRYLVDVNDFKKIVLSGRFNTLNVNTSSTGNAILTYYEYDSSEEKICLSEDLIPTFSDVLQKTLVKK